MKKVFSSDRPSLKNVQEIKNAWDRAAVEGVFEVIDVRKGVSGKGNKYLKLCLQDETGSFDAMIVGDKYEVYNKKNPDPVIGDIVFMMGQNSSEIVWLNSAVIQNNKVFMKLADIK